MNKLITTAMLALASAALFQTAAKAQATTGDLILGFQTTSTTNNGNLFNLEVNLGLASNFTSLTGGTVVNLTNGLTTSGQTGAFSVTDLNTQYGTSATTLKFSVAGTLGVSGSNELFITQPANSAPSLTPSQGTESNSIGGLYPTFNSGTAGAANSTDATVSASTSGSYKNVAGSNGTYGGNYSNAQQTYSTTLARTLYLFDAPQGSTGNATEVGFFTLYGASDSTNPGQLTFTSAEPLATPEPSTYALFGFSALAMIIAIRRRNSLQS